MAQKVVDYYSILPLF